jgi:large subunit ribosomal protein L18
MEKRSTVKIYKSLTGIEAQLFGGSETILGKKFKFDGSKQPIELAGVAGEEFAKLVLDKKIKMIRFDRNGFKYHGRVKAFADGMRKAGLEF